MFSRRLLTRLLAATAVAPLTLVAGQALAQTEVTGVTQAPLRTSVTGALTVQPTGTVSVSTGEPAITVDSSDDLIHRGALSIRDAPPGTAAILVDTSVGNLTADITLSGNIIADESEVLQDTDGDGDLDGPFATPGSLRFGLRIAGPGTLTGGIGQTTGAISAEGDVGTAAISIESAVIGNIVLNGANSAQGNGSFGVRLAAPLTGDLTVGGVVQSQGENGVAVSVEQAVSGGVRLTGSITSSGFRYVSRAAVPNRAIDNLDADDLLIGGPAVRVMASLGRGLVVDAPPPNLDPADFDEDDDGILDENEPAGQIFSVGSAPAILIGSADPIVLGNLGTADRDAYGLLIRGLVDANGVYDGISSTGVQVGGLGGTVDTSGGVIINGTLRTAAFQADTLALHIADGAVAPVIRLNRGIVSAGVNTDEDTVARATAILIDSAANVSAFDNEAGLIRAGVTGPEGTAVAVLDRAGQISTVRNAGNVLAALSSNDPTVTPEGEAIAFDLRANTTGVAFLQEAPAAVLTPSLEGDVLFGTGAFNDTFTVNAGRTSGAVAFGGGDDVLSVSGENTDARVGLNKTSGALDIDVNGGRLALTNTNRVDATSLDVAGGATLTFTADPQNQDPTQRSTFLNVAGQATFAEGARVGIEFASKLRDPTVYTVLSAGDLVNGGINDDLLGRLPFIYSGQLTVEGDDINVAVRRATLQELGIESGRAAMYEAFFEAFDSDRAVELRVLSKQSAAEFQALYQQFLPDYSGGPFRALALTTREAVAAQSEAPSNLSPTEPRSWLQEVGASVRQESVADVPYDTGGFGIAGGIERPMRGGSSFIGVSGSFQSAEVRNRNRAIGSYLSASALTASLYWRGHRGDLVLDSSITGGVAWFDSVRRIVDRNAAGVQFLTRQAEADWTGLLAGARFGAAYDWESGPFYVRPEFVLDAIYLSEEGYSEVGGGNAVNLMVGRRSNYEAAAQAGILIGARYGQSFKWGPELRVAYRAILANGDGETTGSFVAVPGSTFAIPGLAPQDGLLSVRLALRGHGAYSNVALEAGGDIGDDYAAYMARLMVMFLF